MSFRIGADHIANEKDYEVNSFTEEFDTAFH